MRIQDVLKWMLIMAIIIIAFIVSFTALSSCDAAIEDPDGTATLPMALLYSLLTGDALGAGCVLETPAGSTWGVGLSVFYLVLAYVLMFNLLIAILSKVQTGAPAMPTPSLAELSACN